MSDQNQRVAKRMQKITALEAKVKLGNQESTPAEPEAASTRQESKSDTLLRNIFFRSGTLAMAPDSSE